MSVWSRTRPIRRPSGVPWCVLVQVRFYDHGGYLVKVCHRTESDWLWDRSARGERTVLKQSVKLVLPASGRDLYREAEFEIDYSATRATFGGYDVVYREADSGVSATEGRGPGRDGR